MISRFFNQLICCNPARLQGSPGQPFQASLLQIPSLTSHSTSRLSAAVSAVNKIHAGSEARETLCVVRCA